MTHQAIALALSPLLLVQAVVVRRRALILPEAGGPRQGRSGQGQTVRVLVLGDSSAAGVGVTDQSDALSGQIVKRLALHRHISWQVIARTGATTATTLARLYAEPPAAMDVVVTALGVNDVTKGAPLTRWLDQQRRLWDMLIARGARRILVSGLPPMGAFPVLPQPLRWVLGRRAAMFDNALRNAILDCPHTRHIPMDFAPTDRTLMAADGFHPGPDLYAQWAERVAGAILADTAGAT
ncbi:MAG: SGNH/GDSL hydrolase family protein [Gemmobacter sp.]|nr:SGNH/GDSL hydrolase family protein [Gemmobacter sp.]